MTDLPTILPDFLTRPYSHLIPSLERNGITVADLLSLDALEIAKRASLPILDLRRLARDVIGALQDDVGINVTAHSTSDELFSSNSHPDSGRCRRFVPDIVKRWDAISMLDATLDQAIGGGIPAGYVTEITGESAAGKTQFLLTLLLSAQLPCPVGLSRSSIYISTEAALSTTRLSQLLGRHPRLSKLPAAEKPSLSRVLAIPVQDLESQDHILAFQLPYAIRKYHVGLVILDSVAANYRAEHGSAIPKDLANRAAQLAKLGRLLRDLAKREHIAVVVANQVSDRFEEVKVAVGQHRLHSSSPIMSSSPVVPDGQGAPPLSAGNTDNGAQDLGLSLDFQQRFFTGWGDELYRTSYEGLKTPALGLAWTNQIACRIALRIEAVEPNDDTHGGALASYEGGNVWKDRKKRRFLRLVFAPWAPATRDPIEYEIRPDGIASCNTNEIQV